MSTTRIIPYLALLVLTTTGATVSAGDEVLRKFEPDAYTRYVLLDPDSHSFRIVYDVTATTPGATSYFNSIRAGSRSRDEAVLDRATGKPLDFEVIDGEAAAKLGNTSAKETGRYIHVKLARPVPQGGETRIRIEKTYTDAASYRRDGGEIVFTRSLGIKRNAIVLPAGYELTRCNVPSQVIREPDGRLKVTFWNPAPVSAPLEIRARLLEPTGAKELGREIDNPVIDESRTNRIQGTFADRPIQDREIVYFLQQPETHSFRLYHDYTERRPGVDRYVNVVRKGSRASDPIAWCLDTGEPLQVVELRGPEIEEAGVDIGREAQADTEVVLIRFEPVKEGGSARIRIEETYTDAGRYFESEGQLTWNRHFGRPLNAIVLPEGWFLTDNAIPGTISTTADGRTRIDYVNPRPDGIQVLVRARHR